MQQGKEKTKTKNKKKRKKLWRDDFLPSTHTETQHDESQTPPPPPFGRELRFALRCKCCSCGNKCAEIPRGPAGRRLLPAFPSPHSRFPFPGDGDNSSEGPQGRTYQSSSVTGTHVSSAWVFACVRVFVLVSARCANISLGVPSKEPLIEATQSLQQINHTVFHALRKK